MEQRLEGGDYITNLKERVQLYLAQTRFLIANDTVGFILKAAHRFILAT